jgi:hypothetical protein
VYASTDSFAARAVIIILRAGVVLWSRALLCVYIAKGGWRRRALREFYDPLNGHSNKRPPKLYFIAV